MNYTREPLVESVITPKEGCKLVVRCSSGVGQEDYFVDAVEVVSFGQALFFRSTERPKSFLVPVSHYEIIEVKETRMVLKTASLDKSIKISHKKEGHERKSHDRKRRKLKKRKSLPPKKERGFKETMQPPPEEELGEKGGEVDDETQVSSSIVKKLFPPPTTLIKEQLSRYKDEEAPEENIFAEEVIQEATQEVTEEDIPPSIEEFPSLQEEGENKIDVEEQPIEEEKKEE